MRHWYWSRLVSDSIERWPRLYVEVMRYRWRNSRALKRIVDSKANLVIEGFPRSANSFALAALRSVNGDSSELRIATHIHSTAQVKLAVKWGLPCMVLIREPDGAVPSLLAYAVQLDKLRAGDLSQSGKELLVRYWIKRYVSFYQQIRHYRDKVLFVDFEEVIQDFGAVTRRFNEKFDTQFECFFHSNENVKRIFQGSRVHLSPSAERDALKASFEQVYFSENFRDLRERANVIYREFPIHRIG